jgi:hypothetical protein
MLISMILLLVRCNILNPGIDDVSNPTSVACDHAIIHHHHPRVDDDYESPEPLDSSTSSSAPPYFSPLSSLSSPLLSDSRQPAPQDHPLLLLQPLLTCDDVSFFIFSLFTRSVQLLSSAPAA